MISNLEHSEVQEATAPTTAPGQATARGDLIEAAYNEYHRRRQSGAKVDPDAFLKEFEAVRSSLAKQLHADDFLEENPHLLIDGPSAWPEAGTIWEGFELLEELGRGSFARVYLARELALGGRLVAVKCTTLGAREAATLGRLDHPHVVPIHSINDLPDYNLTVVCMPYLGRATLAHVFGKLRDQAQPIRRATALLDACRDERMSGAVPPTTLRRGCYLDGVRWIAARVAGALAYLHGQGICHRDLKPSNILLQPDGTPRLLDFNLSADARLPQAMLGGTLQYMAPEQLEAFAHGDDAVLSPKVDVFALGVILYEWLTGRHPCAPLPTDGSAKVLHAHLLGRYRQVQQPLQLPGVASSLTQLIERCLRRRPEERPTAAAIEQALRRQLQPGPRLLRHVGRHPLRFAGAALLLVFALALGAVQSANQAPRSKTAYEQGWQAYKAGDYSLAMGCFDDAAAHGADASLCLVARGRVHQRLGEEGNNERFSDALAAYQHAFERTADTKYRAAMGYCSHRMAGQLPAAQLHYERALESGFKSPAVEHNLGCIYLDKSQFKDARKCFERALKLDNRSALTHCQLAQTLVQMHMQRQQEIKDDPENGMPELLRRALDHVQRGLPDIKKAPAAQADQLARIYAAALPYDETLAPQVLTWLERAVEAGANPALFDQNPSFRALRDDPRFLALAPTLAPVRPPLAWVRILDPLAE